MTWRALILYGIPAAVMGYMFRLVAMYSLKFATDVLLVAPATMGLIFGLSRIWDAISDPAVGYMSDRTGARFGRRRSWILAGAVPTGLGFVMLFAPPGTLGPSATTAWMTVAVLTFFTAMTCVAVPHLSWGAELATDSTERNKLYGARHAFEVVGALIALVALSWMISAEREGVAAARTMARNLSVGAGSICALSVALAILALPERGVASGAQRPASVLSTASDIWANPHARLVFFVSLIELVGAGAMGAMALYVAQYVIHAPQIAPVVLALYLVLQGVSVPLWVRIALRIPKHRMWLYSMLVTAGAFGSMFPLAFIESQTIQIALLLGAVAIAALAASCGSTIGPSVLSDIIDFDEWRTHERKEGAYFAAWSFAGKSAGGLTLMLSGIALSAMGFVPNVEQPLRVKVGMTALIGLFPLVCYAIGAALFSRYSLDDELRTQIQLDLKQRHGFRQGAKPASAVPRRHGGSRP